MRPFSDQLPSTKVVPLAQANPAEPNRHSDYLSEARQASPKPRRVFPRIGQAYAHPPALRFPSVACQAFPCISATFPIRRANTPNHYSIPQTLVMLRLSLSWYISIYLSFYAFTICPCDRSTTFHHIPFALETFGIT